MLVDKIVMYAECNPSIDNIVKIGCNGAIGYCVGDLHGFVAGVSFTIVHIATSDYVSSIISENIDLDEE